VNKGDLEVAAVRRTISKKICKNAVYTSKPRTLQDLRRETEIARATVPLSTIQNVCQSISRRYQQSLAAVGGHFEHL
jgi:hypothetical protein